MTLGQEFSSYAVMVEEDEHRIREALVHLHEINLGATAIGTGRSSRHSATGVDSDHVTGGAL